MNHLFVKRYNPAYDFFLIRYFREGGIEVEGLTWKRANYKQLLLKRKESMTPHEKLFWAYARAWTLLPECKPTLFDFFERIIQKKLDIGMLKVLESQLRPDQGKLLFSVDEVARDISNFYKRYIKQPLEKDIKQGNARELSKFLLHDEHSRVLRFRKLGREKMDEETLSVSAELNLWLEKITPKVILKDLNRILESHFNTAEHMRVHRQWPADKQVRRCEHSTEYLRLTALYDSGTGNATATLTPIRGDSQVEEGWEEVLFPCYYVKEAL